jgi:NADH dehydrogenase [ubiquinone] 1 alpha subcomplex assembly factor 5
MSASIDLFQLAHARHFAVRRQDQFHAHDFLFQRAAADIRERLNEITRNFQSVLLCGGPANSSFQDIYPQATRLAMVTPALLSGYVGQFDLIIVLGELHRANDLPGLLVQLRRALLPDGVMLAAFAGGETLRELRQALMQAEISVLGGASPRVFPFVDTQQMAGLMQRAGFSLPVIDSEVLSVSYRDMFHVMDDVRGMAESNYLSARYKSITPSRLFFEAARIYQESYAEPEGRVVASFEIIFLIGWAPHESQQKPARRGSGQVSLAEIL